MPEKERVGQGKAKSNTRRQIKREKSVKHYSKEEEREKGRY
jgi:hypothetical protein